MFDLVNVDVGGNQLPPVHGSVEGGTGVKRAATPRRPVTNGTRTARRILKAFDTLEDFDHDFAREFWDATGDAQKMRVAEFVEAMHRELMRRIEFDDLHTVTEEHLAEVYGNE